MKSHQNLPTPQTWRKIWYFKGSENVQGKTALQHHLGKWKRLSCSPQMDLDELNLVYICIMTRYTEKSLGPIPYSNRKSAILILSLYFLGDFTDIYTSYFNDPPTDSMGLTSNLLWITFGHWRSTLLKIFFLCCSWLPWQCRECEIS